MPIKYDPIDREDRRESDLAMLTAGLEEGGAILGLTGEEYAKTIVDNTSPSIKRWYDKPLEERLALIGESATP